MVIRPATAADTDACVAMGLHFLASGPYRDRIAPSAEHQASLVAYLLAHGALFVCDDRARALVGMIGLTLVPLPISGELTASELVWWIEPEARGAGCGTRLLDAGERWATDHAAVWMQMIAPHGADAVARRYLERGYTPLETTYTKRLRAA